MSSISDSSRAAGSDARTQSPGRVEVLPIGAVDIGAVAEFMASGMASGTTAAHWHGVMTPPWDVEQPNHGYHLRADGQVVGAYLALYSERRVAGGVRKICNLGAWCVAESHRAAGLRMLRALLRQKGYGFTDLTPNPTVVALNTRLGFTALDTETAMVPNIPWPTGRRGVRVVDKPHDVASVLTGAQLALYRDHAGTAVRHLVLVRGDDSCYVMYRRDWYLRLPLFATILHVSDPRLFAELQGRLCRYLLTRRAIPATLAEIRVAGRRPARSLAVPGRTRMFFGDDLDADSVDYLYSELTCLTD